MTSLANDIDIRKIDKNSATWITFSAWVEQRLQDLREDNDNITLSEAKTQIIRGRIKMLKEIIGLIEKQDENMQPQIGLGSYVGKKIL